MRTSRLALRLGEAQVGFSDATALSRATKTHFGLTPRELRKHGPRA
jgi:AraC-like DNA-binding protein